MHIAELQYCSSSSLGKGSLHLTNNHEQKYNRGKVHIKQDIDPKTFIRGYKCTPTKTNFQLNLVKDEINTE